MAKNDSNDALHDIMSEQHQLAQRKGKMSTGFKGAKVRRTEEVERVENQHSPIVSFEDDEPRSVAKPRSERTAKLSLVITPALKTRLKVYCAAHGTTLAATVEQILEEFLDAHE